MFNTPIKIVFICVLLSAYTSKMIAQDYVWAQSMGNIKSDKCTSLRTDSAGFIYAAGYFSSSLILGTNNLNLTNVANATSKETWIAKFDSTGYCYWAIAGGEYYDDRILGFAVDAAGNTVITGTYWQTNTGITIGGLTIGAGPGNGSADQCFVAKIDPNGNMLWGALIRSNQGDDQGMDVAMDKLGNIYVCGFMTGNDLMGNNVVLTTDVNSAAYEQPYWLVKMDATGNFIWGKTFGNLPFDTAYGKYIERDIAICIDENNDPYVTGGFDHTRVFEGTSLTSRGSYDGFLIKYKSDGTFAWAKNFGSRKKDWANGICSDFQGHIYITGEHRDSLYYDNQFMARNYNGRDVFVLKINSNDGSPVWGARAGSQLGGERGNDVIADQNCNVYVCGDVHDGAKFGDNIILPIEDGLQSFVAKISTDGKWTWVATGGGPDSNDRANGIALGVHGQIYSGGFMRSPGKFGSTTLSTYGKSDIWITRVHDSFFNQTFDFDLKKPSNREFCLGGSTTMAIPTNDFFDYTPKTGVTQNGNLLTFQPTVTTQYTVFGSKGTICKSYDTVSFTIEVYPIPTAAFTLSPITVPLNEPNFTLTNESMGATNYEWIYNNNLLNTSVDIKYAATDTGMYCFELKAISDKGCRDSVSHCGKVIKQESFFLPNAFSPNDDGLNDIFKPSISHVEYSEITDYQLIITNRWGQIVFQSKNPMEGWEGNYLNEPAPIGTYYFMCTYKGPYSHKKTLRGDLSLLR